MNNRVRTRREKLLDQRLAGEISPDEYERLLAEVKDLAETPDGGRDTASMSTAEAGTAGRDTTAALADADRLIGVDLGDYRIESLIARGGMGEVWKAYSEVENRHVVIKVLPRELGDIPEEMERVSEMFGKIHDLQHENICPVYKLGQDSRVGYYLVMKYLAGTTLSAYRRAFVRRQESFPLAEAARVLQPVAAALDYAHSRQVIHRDIKPQNIMLRDDGSDVQIVDFGLATEIRTRLTQATKVRMDTTGTYPYMAPEQWQGKRQDERTDQYALAVVAYELLAGQPPFEAADEFILRQCALNEPVPELPDQAETVNRVLGKALAKKREDRYSSCSEFVRQLREAESTPPAKPGRRGRASGAATSAGKSGSSAKDTGKPKDVTAAAGKTVKQKKGNKAASERQAKPEPGGANPSQKQTPTRPPKTKPTQPAKPAQPQTPAKRDVAVAQNRTAAHPLPPRPVGDESKQKSDIGVKVGTWIGAAVLAFVVCFFIAQAYLSTNDDNGTPESPEDPRVFPSLNEAVNGPGVPPAKIDVGQGDPRPHEPLDVRRHENPNGEVVYDVGPNGEGIAEAVSEAFVKQYDTDGDGVVSAQELMDASPEGAEPDTSFEEGGKE